MVEQFTPYKPKHLAEDMTLSVELRERGNKCAFKRLAKEKKGLFPKTGTPDDYSYTWCLLKKGTKKDKMAMVLMACQHDFMLEQLDRKEGKVLELSAKTKSQEDEIKLLKLNQLQWDKEKMQWLQLQSKVKNQEEAIKELQQELLQWEEQCGQLNCKVSKLKAKTDSQNQEITSLKQKVQKQKEKNEQLKDKVANYNTSCDDTKIFPRLSVPVTHRASRQRSHSSLLAELPDLQYDNSNYEFWAKIKSWLLKEEVDPQDIYELVCKKCPLKAWLATEKAFDNKALTELTFSKSVPMATQSLQKLWKCVSEALGPGTKQFERYYYRRQNNNETFEEYFEEKFRLYCSYGVDNMEPDKNDRHFLCNVLEKASKHYQVLALAVCPKSYTDLLCKAMVSSSMLTTAEWNDECLNCGRKGHTKV